MGPCKHDKNKVIVKAGTSGQIFTSVTDIITHLRKVGPLTIALSANNEIFRYYKSGIIKLEDNCPTQINHAVAIVGYNVDVSTYSTGTNTATWTTTTCRSATKKEQ